MNFLTESKSAWEQLLDAKQQSLPIVIYGMGNAADKIIDFCELHKIQIDGIFASDEFVRGQSFRGYKIEHYHEILDRLGNNFLLVLAFASERPELLTRFQQLAKQHPTIAPHLGLFDNDVVTKKWLNDNNFQLTQAYNLLADDYSRFVFCDMLNYKFSGKIKYLFNHTTQRRADFSIFNLTENETYFDFGAYDGDTVKEFLTLTDNHYNHILAVEPDNRSFQKLTNNYQHLKNFHSVNCAMWNEQTQVPFYGTGGRQASVYGGQKETVPANTIDNLVEEYNLIPTYIKMDIEGTETETLTGGNKTISCYKPKMLIAGYHFDADLFRIPLKLHELNPHYQIYLRKHPYVPDWEINFFVK
ncbi:MAG: FkbM family methyltransferase [Acidaminococcaceae bacterium]|nr:FkbM family methyltransferase [Acidaminococcaceae bacterium]